MPKADWYFDFVSPFSYLQRMMFDRLPAELEVAATPVLFAGLLARWEHKGPAEIPGKRRYTYRFCKWFADRNAIPFVMPPAHPFNPLSALRLAVALDAAPEVVDTIFRFVFAEGRDPSDPAEWAALTARLGVADAAARIADPAVKDALRQNTETAAARGVFGVPTFAIGEEFFWGVEATDMLLDYLRDPGLFAEAEMARISDLPVGVSRRP